MLALADSTNLVASPRRPADSRAAASRPLVFPLPEVNESEEAARPAERPIAEPSPRPQTAPSPDRLRRLLEEFLASISRPNIDHSQEASKATTLLLAWLAGNPAGTSDPTRLYADLKLSHLASALTGVARIVRAGSDVSTLQHQVEADLAPTIQRIAEFSALETDWDSYGGKPPTARALDTAARSLRFLVGFLAPIVGKRALPFWVSPLPSGGVQLEWRSPAAGLEVEIDSRGNLAYLYQSGHGPNAEYEEGEDVSLPKVVALLGRGLTR